MLLSRRQEAEGRRQEETALVSPARDRTELGSKTPESTRRLQFGCGLNPFFILCLLPPASFNSRRGAERELENLSGIGGAEFVDSQRSRCYTH
jgi:hypothetical protein